MTCQIAQNLCGIFRGDTIPFTFQFNDSDGNPIDISGMKLYFTMKLNKSSPDGEATDLQDVVTFPTDPASQAGQGNMTIPSTKTQDLSVNRDYFYDFELVDGNIVSTVGWGQVKVEQDVTLAG